MPAVEVSHLAEPERVRAPNIRDVARVAGVYAPGFYAVTYGADGAIAEVLRG